MFLVSMQFLYFFLFFSGWPMHQRLLRGALAGSPFLYCLYFFSLLVISLSLSLKKTITGIAFSTHDSDLLVSAGTDLQVVIYSVSKQRVVAKVDNLRAAPASIAWCTHDKETISFIYGKGPLYLWNYTVASSQQALNAHRDVQSFMSNVCQIRWHPNVMQKLVCGHADGGISLFTPGTWL